MKLGSLRVIALVALLGTVHTGSARSEEVEVGRPFPDVVLPALADGSLTRLSALTAGRRVLLIQFASW